MINVQRGELTATKNHLNRKTEITTMDTDREKWNRRFASEDSYLGSHPSPFLLREIKNIEKLVPGIRALDIACGEGRNSLFLSERGFQVTALDISDVGLAKGRQRADELGLEIDFRQVDLQETVLDGEYDLVLNFNFLLRELIPQEMALLVPNGILLFDTIREAPKLLQSHNPDYLLRNGELKRIAAEYAGEILCYEEVEAGEMPTARLMFRKAGHSLSAPGGADYERREDSQQSR